MRRTYSIANEAWWFDVAVKPIHEADGVVHEINIEVEGDDEVLSGSFTFRWHQLGNHFSPRLEAFDDALGALGQCLDIVERFAGAHSRGITWGGWLGLSPDRAREALDQLGYVDVTPRTQEVTA